MVTPIDGVTMSQNIPQYSQVRTTWVSTNSSRLTPANLPRSCSVSVMSRPPQPLATRLPGRIEHDPDEAGLRPSFSEGRCPAPRSLSNRAQYLPGTITEPVFDQ